MSTFEWDDLRYFLAFARAGSMQGAAKALSVNQSTVQRRIAVLEKWSGHRIVERHLGSYRLTELGSELLSGAEQVEAAVATFKRRVAATDTGLTGLVRVTCGSNLAGHLASSTLLDVFHARNPGLRLELVISDRFLDLARGEADIAIRRGEPRDESLVGRKIADASWSVYGSHTYVERHGRPDKPDNLSGHLVIGCDGSISDYPGAKWARSVVPPAKVVTRSDSWQGLMLAVKSGAGLAAMPRWQAEREPGLVCFIDDIGLHMPYYLLMHRDMQLTPRVRAFADFVASEIKAFRALLTDEGQVQREKLHDRFWVRIARKPVKQRSDDVPQQAAVRSQKWCQSGCSAAENGL